VCKNCGYELEEMQGINEPPLTHCPQCKTDSLARAASTGSGLIFKGTGFYLTDYKKESAPTGKQESKKETAATGSDKKETSGEKTEKKETPGEKQEKPKKEGGEKSSEKKDG